MYLARSWEYHPHFLERVKICGQSHPCDGVETVFGWLGIHNLADGDVRGKNPGVAAGFDGLAWFQCGEAREVAIHLYETAVEGAGGADHAGVPGSVIHLGGYFEIGVAEQDDSGVREADGRDAADQKAFGGQHGEVVAEAITGAEIN